MASYNELNALIDAYINRNGVQAITGQVLNGVLKTIVEQIGRGYAMMGVATPSTDPGTPDAPETYYASTAGTYTNFDNIQLATAELAMLCYDPGTGWSKQTIYDGFAQVNATVGMDVGTPTVQVTYQNGVLSFAFDNLKGHDGLNGEDGIDGEPAGFGEVQAMVDNNVGTPSVEVTTDGPNTAKNFYFDFHNLKGIQGDTGVTSVVVTVDNTSGNPQCTASLLDQQLTLAFTGLKGAQGDTGVSADYPITIVNNLTTNDPTSALSAAQGVVLEGEISQLEADVADLQDGETVLQQQIDAIQPIVIEGNVTNAPDEEDITTDSNDLLKFADRSATLTNKGYKILRADKTFAQQVTDINTIYEVRYAFDLDGTDFALPSGSILRFNGGKVYGANITGNKMPTTEVYTPEMFGAGMTADDTQAIQNAVNICYKVRLDGDYNVASVPGYETPAIAAGRAYENPCIIVPADSDIEINGTVSLTTANLASYALFSLYYLQNDYLVKNVKIHGQGKLVGDANVNTGTGEHGMGIAIGGYVENIEVSGLEIYNMFGDAIYLRAFHDKKRNVNVNNVYLHHCRRQGISITMGDGYVISNFRIENISGTAPQAPIDIENETEEDYGIGDVIIRNGYIRGCANALICNATAYKARYILVENVDTEDKGINAYYNTVIRNCVSKKTALAVSGNSVVESCTFGGLSLSNTTNDTCFIKDSKFEGANGAGKNAYFEDCVFEIHNYDESGVYESIRALYLTNTTLHTKKFVRCSIICDDDVVNAHFCALYGSDLDYCQLRIQSPRVILCSFTNSSIVFTRALSNGYLNKKSDYQSCDISFPNSSATQSLYEFSVSGSDNIYVIDCVVKTKITSPRSRINGTDNNYIHDSGTVYRFLDGTPAYPTAGTTATRTGWTMVPEQVGMQYFDTDLGKTVVYNGTAWVNMDGTALS